MYNHTSKNERKAICPRPVLNVPEAMISLCWISVFIFDFYRIFFNNMILEFLMANLLKTCNFLTLNPWKQTRKTARLFIQCWTIPNRRSQAWIIKINPSGRLGSSGWAFWFNLFPQQGAPIASTRFMISLHHLSAPSTSVTTTRWGLGWKALLSLLHWNEVLR